MSGLRTMWGKRWLAALMLASLLPITIGTLVPSVRPAYTYADWVRAQLREPADAAIEEALETAEEARARSLDAFLVAFARAYEAQQPDTPLAHRFALDLSDDALLTYLKSKYRGLASEAVPPRAELVATKLVASQDSQRFMTPHALPVRTDHTQQQWAALLRQVALPLVVYTVRLLSAAQPLGP